MKLFYVANLRLPTEKAHGIQIMKMCEALALNGCDVQLCCPWRFNDIIDDPFEYYNIKKIFTIKKIPCLDLIPLDGLFGNFSFWVQTFSFLIFFKIYLFFQEKGIVYTREQFVGLLFNNFVLEVHDLPLKIKILHQKIWQKAKKMIVLTSIAKIRLLETGLSEEKIMIAADGVDIQDFDVSISKDDARVKLGLPRDKRIIMYSGSFFRYGWKGVDILLSSIQYFDSNYVFVLLGCDEKEKEDIEKKYKLDNLWLVTRRPHREMAIYLKSADVLILPNKSGDITSENYTSPLKLFEYMAANRPIVASDLPSIREILNERNAILIKPDDPFEIVKGIQRVFMERDSADILSEQAFMEVKKYSWEKRARNILDFIIG